MNVTPPPCTAITAQHVQPGDQFVDVLTVRGERLAGRVLSARTIGQWEVFLIVAPVGRRLVRLLPGDVVDVILAEGRR